MRVLRLVGVVSIVLLLAAACGDDDDTTDAAAPTDTTSTTEGGDTLAFCRAYIEAGSALSAATSGEEGEEPAHEETTEHTGATTTTVGRAQATTTTTAAPDASTTTASEGEGTGSIPPELDQALTEAEELAPAEVEDEVADVASQVRGALENGDTSVLEAPEFSTLDDGVDQFVSEECADETVQATGIDYAFEGVPAELGSGLVSVLFANEGEELHELAVFRIPDDVGGGIEELLNDPEGQSQLEDMGHLFAAPGASDTETFDLEPGRYGYVCFIPVGLTPEAAESAEEPEGEPHFTEGMFGELTVT